MRYGRRAGSKYGAVQVSIGGQKFDSIKESERFRELLLMEKAGVISELRRQVEFELLPAQREPDTIGKRGGVIKGKTIEKKVVYRADFVYKDKDGNLCVEDVKGYKGGQAYAVFSLKRKMLLYFHGLKIREV